jgi:hypothetical protein
MRCATRHLSLIRVLCLAGLSLMACRACANDELLEFEVTYSGMTIGTMKLAQVQTADGTLTRSLHLKSSRWLATMGATIDDHIRSETARSPQGTCITVTKDVKENRFQRKESFTFWPEAGICMRTNRHQKTLERIEIPKDAHDMFALFLDLGKTLQHRNDPLTQELTLIADGKIYPLHVESKAPERIRTEAGKIQAIEVNLTSPSTKLFSKAVPKRAYFAAHLPLLLAAEIKTPFGTIHAALTSWKVNGVERTWACDAAR